MESRNVQLSLEAPEDTNLLQHITEPAGTILISLVRTSLSQPCKVLTVFTGQYGDGVVGTLKINGPASMNYDEDLGTFPITDWYTDNMYHAGFKSELSGTGPPQAKGALINGKMKSAPGTTGIGEYEDVKIEKGKTYRLRLINTSVDIGFKVSLDNHPCKYSQLPFFLLPKY